MTGERHMFQTLTLKEGGTMEFRWNQKGEIIVIGTIGNWSLSINDVWLIDRLKHSLLSIIQFCDNGYEVVFKENICTVVNESDKCLVLKEKRKGNVYKNIFFWIGWLGGSFPSISEWWKVDLAQKVRSCYLERLISKIRKLKLVKGLPGLNYKSNAIYGACQIGKLSKPLLKQRTLSIPLDP